jgi:integrase
MTADEYLYSNILRMIMLTLARSDMVCKLKWDEIKPKWQNSVQGVILWDKHKNDRFGYKSGTVIIDEIRAILDVMDERRRRERIESDYVFPHGPTKVGMDRWLNQPTNPKTMEQRLRRYLAQNEAITTKDATVHGMRTAFSTWAVDVREYDRDLAMITIGHKIKGTEADLIYLRNVRKLSKRHEMMTEWAKFCRSQIKVAQQQTHVVQTNVVPLIRPE